MIDYLMAFICGGLICLIAQILMDTLKILPIYITVSYVVIGSLLESFGIYDWLIKVGRAGAMIPISSFGHSLTHAAILATEENGYFGIFLGIFDMTSSGIMAAILFSFIMAIIFKPRG